MKEIKHEKPALKAGDEEASDKAGEVTDAADAEALGGMTLSLPCALSKLYAEIRVLGEQGPSFSGLVATLPCDVV